VAAGLTAGLILELATRNTVRSLSSTAVDGSPWMYDSVVLFFFVPVRRASRLDPAAALRSE
jgi:hypothetical protein